jgi:hypothetical protein
MRLKDTGRGPSCHRTSPHFYRLAAILKRSRGGCFTAALEIYLSGPIIGTPCGRVLIILGADNRNFKL